MSLSAQRQILHQWCDELAPQHVPGSREFVLVDGNELTTLHAIGETTLSSRNGFAQILLLSAHPSATSFVPSADKYGYIGMLYSTAPNCLQQRRANIEQQKIASLQKSPRRQDEAFDIPELRLWNGTQDEEQEEDHRWDPEPRPWDDVEKRLQERTIWFAGRAINLDDTDELRRDTPDRREQQRSSLIAGARMDNHIEPMMVIGESATRLFLLLSDKPYDYPSMY